VPPFSSNGRLKEVRASTSNLEQRTDRAAAWARASARCRAAAVWAVKDIDLSAEEEAKLEAWLAEDSRHFGAYLRACAVLLRIEKHAAAVRTSFLASNKSNLGTR
jgi:ferric-dicitrate binding protein FerR (iron transport regulator)